MGDDMTLVREFAATQSEPAFAVLVEHADGRRDRAGLAPRIEIESVKGLKLQEQFAEDD